MYRLLEGGEKFLLSAKQKTLFAIVGKLISFCQLTITLSSCFSTLE
jgi:hypothetical protein